MVVFDLFVLWASELCFVVLAVVISVTKEGVKFSTSGDIGIVIVGGSQSTTVDKVLL